MAERDAADRQLERILYLLPAAARKEGASLRELAAALDVEPDRILRDLEEVTARVYYHPAGGADDLQIHVEVDRVRVWTTGEFRRPPKLAPREGLTLHLGLRMLAAEVGPERRDRLLAIACRLERELSTAPARAFLPQVCVSEGTGEEDEVRMLLFQAARERRRCRIRYLKPDATEPEERALAPYVLLYGSGRWYAVGRSEERDAVRAFRLDRMVEIEVLEESFEVPAGFDPMAHVAGGRVYRAEDSARVIVRYGPAIARWMKEQGMGEERADGSVVATLDVADPGWAVRHVLRCGPDAEVLEPVELRTLVRDTAARVYGACEASP